MPFDHLSACAADLPHSQKRKAAGHKVRDDAMTKGVGCTPSGRFAALAAALIGSPQVSLVQTWLFSRIRSGGFGSFT